MPPQQDPYNEKFIREEEDDSVFLALLLAFAIPIVGFFLASKRIATERQAGFHDTDAHMARRIAVVMFFIWLIPISYISVKVIQGFDPPESPEIADVNEEEQVDPDPVKIVVPANIDHKLAWESVVRSTGFRANDVFIRFNPDQTSFKDPGIAKKHLDGIADYAGKYPEAKFAVTGFTNTDDTSVIAQKLSVDRASAVVDELTSRGVDHGRFDSSGRGSFEIYFGYASSDEANRTIVITLEEFAPEEGR